MFARADAQFDTPGPQSFLYPEMLPGLTKPVLQILLAVLLIGVVSVLVSGRLKFVPSRVQFGAEFLYEFVRNGIGREQIAKADMLRYLPLLLTMFTFILVNNLFGFLPFFQLPTMAHIAFPAGLAGLVYVLFIAVGIRRHGVLHYFGKTLFPPSVPKLVWLIYAPFEVLSTFILRPITLALRLFATMFAGHIMLLVFVTGGVYFLEQSVIGLKLLSPVAFLLAVGLSFLELLIQVLQAYVFTMLTAHYIGAALAEGH
ncbi:F0F1 ATP synthase subunit A [Kutzneria albida]|uniref:ATP synthase subunit a n=1 Tax=Kutzneria albida DSM 43870 TaxID=1449976 RepID=W5W7U0_9PSEU|nr:F0F1 ATP synthase subunit A [Kutzneria albida]AHH97193.1 ATP synthase A chain [Kutzneria albida DSM 43870]